MCLFYFYMHNLIVVNNLKAQEDEIVISNMNMYIVHSDI